jgi:hypothetical protein
VTDLDTTIQVRAVADLVGLPLTDEQCRAVAPRLLEMSRLGALLLSAMDTDVLPTDCPRWPDVD